MTRDRQAEVSDFLADPETHAGATVEVIETHISKIFLAGDRAYKLKRAVKLPYADFSTPDIRVATCEKELALNALTAPDLYLGVRRITRNSAGGLKFGGPGTLVDAVVEMARFDQDTLFDRMAKAGRLTPALMSDLAVTIAEFHCAAPVVHESGGSANIAGVLDINRAGFATSTLFPESQVAALDAAFREALGRHAAMLDRREAQGTVRRCHGDLHLRNICLHEDRPTLFDCIEFNDTLATVDVLYDLAFLLMDLWVRDLPDLANLVANRYFDAADDDDGFALLPFFMAVRAEVRAHVIATQAERGGPGVEDCIAAARHYFDLAGDLLRPVPQCAVAIGGLSGSGKTTVSEALAAYTGAPPGARILESDRTRKAMFGVPSDTRLPPEAYRKAVSEQVYDLLQHRARGLINDGASIVVDAVFDLESRRDGIEAALTGSGVVLVGVWLQADPSALRTRVRQRRGGPSDANVDVLDRQLARDSGAIRWTHIASSGQVADTVAAILHLVEGRSQQPDGTA